MLMVLSDDEGLQVFLVFNICIYMNYLVSTFDCSVFDGEIHNIIANAKYCFQFEKTSLIVFPNHQSIPFVINFSKQNQNLLKVDYAGDSFYFLFCEKFSRFFAINFKFNSSEIQITLFNKLCIAIDGELKSEENVENLTFSHYEIFNGCCLIYFNGVRDYVVVIKDKEICFSSYYDECNSSENEKYFMCKTFDILNHGNVFHINNTGFNNYLVYLDEEKLEMKKEFVAFVFLDCAKVKNYSYCNKLLCSELKLENEKDIEKFFPQFDSFYPLSERGFALINKNTLAGIFEFDVKDNEIYNITSR